MGTSVEATMLSPGKQDYSSICTEWRQSKPVGLYVVLVVLVILVILGLIM